MSIIKVKKRENPYASIDKSAITDIRLSWKARGLLCYLLAMPPSWKANGEHLMTQGVDKRHAVREGLNELRKFGYAKLVKTKDENGKLTGSEWHIFEEPQTVTEKPDNRKNRESENPTLGKSNTIKERLNNTINNKKEESKGNSAPNGTHPVVLEAIELALNSSTSKPKGQENKQEKQRAVSTKVKSKFIPFSESLSSPTAATDFKEFLQTYADGIYKHADAVFYVAKALQWVSNTPAGAKAKYADWRVALAGWCRTDGVKAAPQAQHTPPTAAEIGTAKRNAHLEELQKRGLRRPTPQQ